MPIRLSPLAIGAGAVAFYLLTRPKSAGPEASNAPGGPQPLFAGVPYLFVVRFPPLAIDELPEQRETARAFLATKGATLVAFGPASLPPELGPSSDYGAEVVSFRVVPSGRSTVQRGEPFYDLGTLESISRLDGRPFAQEPA